MRRTNGGSTRQAISKRMSFSDQMSIFLRAHANLLLAAAVALLLLQDVFGMHGLLAMRRSQQEAADVQKEINQLNEENRHLQDQVKSLKTDPGAIEHIAREEMGLARPGEVIFKTTPTQPFDGASTNSAHKP
jgi:cell division protein FtsB